MVMHSEAVLMVIGLQTTGLWRWSGGGRRGCEWSSPNTFCFGKVFVYVWFHPDLYVCVFLCLCVLYLFVFVSVRVCVVVVVRVCYGWHALVVVCTFVNL